MDCHGYQPDFSLLETPDVNGDEFLDIDDYLNDQNTALFVHKEDMAEIEAPNQWRSYNESASYQPASPSSPNSFSTPSDYNTEEKRAQETDIKPDTDLFFFDQLFPSVASLGCDSNSIDSNICSEYSSFISPIDCGMILGVPSETLSNTNKTTRHATSPTARPDLSLKPSVLPRQRKRRSPENLK